MIEIEMKDISDNYGTTLKHRYHWLARLGIGIMLLTCVLSIVIRIGEADFTQNYAAARGWLLGLDSNAPTAELLAACCPDVQAHPGILATAHPPLSTLAVLPLTAFPWSTARILWVILSWAAVVSSWQINKTKPLLCFVTFGFWLVGISLGSFEPFLFLMLTVVFTVYRRLPISAAILLGIATALKIYPGILVIGLVLSRRYKMAMITTIVAGLATVLAELILGRGVTSDWLAYAQINTLYQADNERNLSLLRILRGIGPNIPPTIGMLITLVVLVLPLTPKFRQQNGLELMLPVMLLASPICWEQYLGYLSLGKVHRVAQSCLAASSTVISLVWLRIIPSDHLAPVAYALPVAALLFVWYRQIYPSDDISSGQTQSSTKRS